MSGVDEIYGDILKIAEVAEANSALQVGDEARGRVGAQSFDGTIESIGSKIVLVNAKGIRRSFDTVESLTDVQNRKSEQIQQQKEKDVADAELAKQQEKAQRIENSVNIANPTGSWAALAGELDQIGYILYLDCGNAADLEEHEAEYFDWTNGEGLNEDCIKPNTHNERGGGGWRLRFKHQDDLSYPQGVPVTPLGTNEGMPARGFGRFISVGRTIRMDYTASVAELVKAGLRMTCSGTTREVRI